MPINTIGFDRVSQSLTGDAERPDRPVSSATPGLSGHALYDDPVERQRIARETSNYRQLAGMHERTHAAATAIRTVDRLSERVDTTLGEMKKELSVILKSYPPFPPGSEERVRRLREFAGLRAMIDRLTTPPSVDEQQQAEARDEQDDKLHGHAWVYVLTANGIPRTVRTEDLHLGPTGLNIPELVPPEGVDDPSIEQALNRIDQARSEVQLRRQQLRDVFIGDGRSTSDQAMSTDEAEARSAEIQRDVADQPVGFAGESTALLDHLLG